MVRALVKTINMLAGPLIIMAALFVYAVDSGTPRFAPQSTLSITGESAFGLIILIVVLELQYLPFIARRLHEPLRTACATALLGLSCGAASMLIGTMILGHVRPMWMEFHHAVSAAAKGMVYGVALGLILGFANRMWRRKPAR